MEDPIAESLAESQKEISIAEFFEKNRQMLGFDSSARSLITCVKEGVDNSLDACEEAGYLPDIFVKIQDLDGEYKVLLEDNGPGVVKEEIPKIFGKLLYGSRFHKFVQSLAPDQKILIRHKGEIKLVEIGKFCNDFMENEGDEVSKIDEGFEAPSFNRNTGNISWRKITHAIRHRTRNKVYKIETKFGRSIKVTGNHSLFTFDGKDIREVEASNIKPGEEILAPLKTPSIENEEIPFNPECENIKDMVGRGSGFLSQVNPLNENSSIDFSKHEDTGETKVSAEKPTFEDVSYFSSECKDTSLMVSILLNSRGVFAGWSESLAKNGDTLYELVSINDNTLQTSEIPGDLCLVEVENIEETGKPEYVYDISVPNDENFLAGNKGMLCVKNSRGQQGIGISAAVLYGQLTTGKGAKVLSKISPEDPANLYEIIIDTNTNQPEIVKESTADWSRPHGTRIEINLTGMYVRDRKQSIYNYLKYTAVVNPHARITFVGPDGEETIFKRTVNQLPNQPEEIKPHPEGIELGTLVKMLKNTDRSKIFSFLTNEFTKVGRTTAEGICDVAGIDPDTHPSEIDRKMARNLIKAFDEVKIISPPTDCLSPIGEERIEEGLSKEYPDSEFISATTRSTGVHNGNPFAVETGIAYGVDRPEGDNVEVLRFANRVPLLYQKGGCITTKAIKKIDWRRYELDQPGGRGIPSGKVVMLVHVASTNVPFTSESKDAIANVGNIKKEIERALREVGRDLRKYLKRQNRISKRKNKRDTITKILPDIAEKVEKITGKKVPSLDPIIANITNTLLVDYDIDSTDDKYKAKILIKNFDNTIKSGKLVVPMPYELIDAHPSPNKRIRDESSEIECTWKFKVSPDENEEYEISFRTEDDPQLRMEIEGIPEELLTGAHNCGGMEDA